MADQLFLTSAKGKVRHGDTSKGDTVAVVFLRVCTQVDVPSATNCSRFTWAAHFNQTWDFQSFMYPIFIDCLLSTRYCGKCQGYERHKRSFLLLTVHVNQTVSIFIHSNLFQISCQGLGVTPRKDRFKRVKNEGRKWDQVSLRIISSFKKLGL